MSIKAIPTTPVEITDPTLSNFHNQRVIAFNGTQKVVEESLSGYENCQLELETFAKNIRTRGKELQEATVIPPSQELLNEEKQYVLKKYEGFEATLEKVSLLAALLRNTMFFLTPINRTYTQDTQLKENAPELYAQTKHSEEICLEHIVTLSKLEKQVVSLKDKMVQSVNDPNLTWSIQRFCQIVDNGGKPLSFLSCSINYCTKAVVPKSGKIEPEASSLLSISSINHQIESVPDCEVIKEGNEVLMRYREALPIWEANSKKLEELELNVRLRGNALQNEEVVTPEKGELEKERDEYLTEYWKYKNSCKIMEEFEFILSKTMDLLNSKECSSESEYASESEMDLTTSQMIRTIDQISSSEVVNLKNAISHLHGLHEKMTTLFASKVDWSMQFYCQIVDNGGKPLHWSMLLIDNVTTPVVPKPSFMSSASSALTGGNSSSKI